MRPDAESLIAAERFADADSLLRAEIAVKPASADGHFLLAYTLLRENEPSESLEEYTLAAKLRPPSPADLKNVALDYVLLKAYPEADRWITRSLQMNPKDADAWYVLGRIRYERKIYPESVDAFERVLAMEPKSVKAENNLGLAYEGLNRIDDAIAAYRLAIVWEHDSSHPSEQPLLNLAVIMLHRDDLEQALSLLNQAAAIAPRDPKIHEQLGQAYMRQDHPDKAQREFQAALALTPGDASLHFLLGHAYRRQGLEGKAKAELAQAAALLGTHSNPSRE